MGEGKIGYQVFWRLSYIKTIWLVSSIFQVYYNVYI